MLLRAAIVLLLMLNLGAAGWWGLQPASATAGTQAEDVPGLRLVGETGDVARPAAVPPPVAATAATPPAATPPAPTASVPTAVAAATCLRFGPFASAAARDAARLALLGAGVDAVPQDAVARGGRGWKVFLPPQASRETAVAVAEKLKAAGVSDLYVMSKGADTNSIALGRFGSEEAARRREAELRGKGFASVQVEPLGDAAEAMWLHARLPAGVRQTALAGIAPAQPMECGRLR